MFSPKRTRRRRRSEMRLGVKQVDYEVTAYQPRISLTPMLKFWQVRGAKLSGLVVLAGLSFVMYLLFTSPVFFVYTAEIQGNVAVSAREIYHVSGVDSQSIFWLNPAQVAERIRALPNIKAVTVSISLPAQVTIDVVERRPELLWQTGETLWWIDEEGFVVPPKGDVTGMLKIIDDEQQPLQTGARIDPTLVEGAQTLRLLAPDVSVVRYARTQGLIVATPEGWPVYLGNGSEIRAKLVVLTALLADLKERNVNPAFIDVRNPLRPFYRPRSVVRIGQPVPGSFSNPSTPAGQP